MPSYINPATMLGGHIDPKSPFAGALAGVQGAYATKMGDQQIRDTDQDFLANLHKYETDLKDDPLKDAERQFKLEQITSGRAQKDIDQKLETQGQAITKGKQDILSEETKQKGEWLTNFAQYADQYLGLDPMKGSDHELWKEQVADAAKVGIKLPSWPTSQSMDKVKTTAAAYVNSAKQQQKMQEITAQTQAQTEMHADPRLASSVAGQRSLLTDKKGIALAVQDAKDEGAKERAQIKADSQNAAKTFSAQVIQDVSRMLRADLKTDGKLRPETEQAAVSAAEIGAEILLKETEGWDLLVLRAMKNPEAKAEMMARKKEMTMKILSTMPGMDQAAAAGGGKIVSTPQKQYSPKQEEAIAKAMAANPGTTREDIIRDAVAQGKLK